MKKPPASPPVCEHSEPGMVAVSRLPKDDARSSPDTRSQGPAHRDPLPASGQSDDYLARLNRFYAHYNPEKVDRAHLYLQQFAGKEETLFAILVKKYGPEDFVNSSAQPPAAHAEPTYNLKDMFTSANRYESRLGSDGEAVAHYSGKRVRFPKSVSAEDGKTDMETPYWGNPSSPITDRDLMTLLSLGQTDNAELQKCYMGFLPCHPSSSWNGLVYCSDDPNIATAGCMFLGHLWAASLGYRKKLIHAGEQYTRETLFCTTECQKTRGHEQWRLSIYRRGSSRTFLVRTIWDPVVVPEPQPRSRLSTNDGEMLNSAEIMLLSRLSSRSDRSNDTSAREPVQPNLSACISQLARRMSELETKCSSWMSDIDSRLSKLERLCQSKSNHRAAEEHEIANNAGNSA